MELSGKQLGPYTVADVIGHTRWGEVYRATQTAVNRLVALKVISLELMEEPGTVDRFLASARKAAQISFDGVVAVYEVRHAVAEVRKRCRAGLGQAGEIVRSGELVAAGDGDAAFDGVAREFRCARQFRREGEQAQAALRPCVEAFETGDVGRMDGGWIVRADRAGLLRDERPLQMEARHMARERGVPLQRARHQRQVAVQPCL